MVLLLEGTGVRAAADCGGGYPRLGPDVQVVEMCRPLMTAPDVARKLQISLSHFKALVAKGVFPQPIRIGRATRWNPKTVDEWVSSEETKPAA